ncbi:helix-turn-helix transcriptional regulator [uncultured Delftia sp.]|jgi:putative transcriptional regulator|uniref:helix-turn-helix domain-containing protein n=1 Tax=uncultured Delftia sp. TaxID=191464 RepID=UPI0025936EBD|nr:helix-turn-helix transcriptional regulator [uncultured Delftia sp.]
MSTIKAIRERLGLSQLALGRGIGCTQGNIFHYERGQTLPPDAAKRVITFAAEHGLDLTMDQIYGLQPLPANTKESSHA